MRIAVFGAGSIGGPVAARLAAAGHDVLVYAGNPAIAEAIERDGIHVYGVGGELHQRVRVRLAPAPEDRVDVALLAMKTDRLRAGVAAALPVLASDGFVVCFQNGVPEPSASEVAGAARVVGGVVSWGGSMEGPGRCRVTSRGRIVLGEARPGTTARIEQLVRVFNAAGLASKVTANLPGVRWSKLALNCTITTLGGVSGLLLGEMVRIPAFREVAFTVMSEVVDVARASGVRLEKVAGTLDIGHLYVPPEGDSSRWRAFLRHALLSAVAIKYRRLRSGITRSLARGRKPEIDALNGFVAASGERLGLAVPMNAALTRMVEELTDGTRQARVEVWRELLALARTAPRS